MRNRCSKLHSQTANETSCDIYEEAESYDEINDIYTSKYFLRANAEQS